MFNAMDFLILATLLAIIGAGFFGGVTRVTSAILALYFGAVFAAAFYRPLSDVARKHIATMAEQTGDLVFFLLLFFMFSIVFTIIVSRWIGEIRLPRGIQVFDNIGGAALGVIVSGLAMTLAAMLLAITLQALNQTIDISGRDAMLTSVREQINESTLVPIFLRMAPFFGSLISPWFPGDLPPILSTVPA
ncbi:MAG TPA: CvpA family protein [Thermomicrobiales bacterium]|nr:CvpA family protein [Thermomicrobiales bacterium]